MSLIAAPFAILAILYAGGFLAQLLGNYATWKHGGGIPGDGTSPLAASPDFLLCLSSVLRPPYGVYGILICIGLLAVPLIMVMRMGYGDAGEYDEDRNFSYSAKGTYGTSGWMSRKEMSGVLDLVPDLRKHKGVVLGMLDGKAVCIPEDTRINSNLAVYGASGSMKTRSFCMNRILQATVRGENGAGESLIICDPKSELYEKSSEFLRSRGYCVKVFNLVSPENSDSWCCLAEVEGQELMAQLFVDVIIKNTTNNGKSDHFWDACEMNLLKALVLYVDQGYAEENRNIGEVYRLLTLNGESQLDTLFEALPSTHPAKAPYSLFKQASDTVRSGVIIGLGSRLQVFQSELIKKITAKNEIDLELPGYYQYWSYAEKKGYSGTALFSKEEPLSVSYGLGIEKHDHEGRVITAEYPDYYVVTCYTPNSQNELARLPYRMQWEDDFRQFLKKLEEKKPVIFCGDLNVAHTEIDLKNPKTNRKNAGFTDEERSKFTELLDSGYIDTYRYFYPDKEGVYSWWSYRFKAREKNAGWRIDYFCVSKSLKDRLAGTQIHTEILGSDHCPVELQIKDRDEA